MARYLDVAYDPDAESLVYRADEDDTEADPPVAAGDWVAFDVTLDA